MLVTLSQVEIMRDPRNFKYFATKGNPKYLSSHLILLMWLSGLEGMIFESLRGCKCNNILHVHYYAQIISFAYFFFHLRLLAHSSVRAVCCYIFIPKGILRLYTQGPIVTLIELNEKKDTSDYFLSQNFWNSEDLS